MEGLGFRLRSEAHLRTLTEDVVKSSEIEGEKLDSAQVRSSIARKLGLDVGGLVPSDRNVDGVVELMVDATSKYASFVDSRAAIRLACRAVPDRSQLADKNHRR